MPGTRSAGVAVAAGASFAGSPVGATDGVSAAAGASGAVVVAAAALGTGREVGVSLDMGSGVPAGIWRLQEGAIVHCRRRYR